MTPSGETNAASSAPAPPPAVRYGAVLVPVDGSDLAERALAPAAWLADRFDATLHHVAARVARDERRWHGAATTSSPHGGDTDSRSCSAHQ